MSDATSSDVKLWAHTLFQQLTEHVNSEADIEAEYRELAATTEAPDVRYLVELILEDEERHHRVFRQIVESVRSLVEGEGSPEVPLVSKALDPGELLTATKRFLAIERQDARTLRQLQKELAQVEETTLWSLLVRLMVLDTEKHMEILRFLARSTAP